MNTIELIEENSRLKYSIIQIAKRLNTDEFKSIRTALLDIVSYNEEFEKQKEEIRKERIKERRSREFEDIFEKYKKNENCLKK